MRKTPLRSSRRICAPAKEKNKLVFIVGPTAVGKSETAAALAQRLGAEIVSCDSMQIYKGMGVITSKPAPSLLKKVPHHLIAVVPPGKEYDVSRFRREALARIRQIIKDNKTPLLVGGTGLYMSMLVDGIFEEKAQDKDVRSRLIKEEQKSGSPRLHRRLQKLDPSAAAKIHPNDARRIIRALEVFQVTGKPISVLQKQRKGLADEYQVRIFCLDMERDKLYRRIDSRVDKMFKAGLLAEAKKLLKLKLSRTASYAIGLRELKDHFSGAITLEQAKELIKRNSRRYAKRQLTWFRKDKRIQWVKVSPGEKPAKVANRILKKLKAAEPYRGSCRGTTLSVLSKP